MCAFARLLLLLLLLLLPSSSSRRIHRSILFFLPGAARRAGGLAAAAAPASCRTACVPRRRGTSASSPRMALAAASLPAFLAEAKAAVAGGQRPVKVVMGNEAADADSIVSSVCLAQYLDATRSAEDRAAGIQYVPVLPLPRVQLKLRPETLLLLRVAHLAAAVKDLVCLDELDLLAAQAQGTLVGIVLVDHNKLQEPLRGLGTLVEGIVDHHEDQGEYDWVVGPRREVAFSTDPTEMANSVLDVSSSDSSLGSSSAAGGRALVASTCTLVAERFLAPAAAGTSATGLLLHTDVATLLAGVILLDAVCLEPRAGKVTPRDVAAVEALMGRVLGGPSKEELYKTLSAAKFDREWWRSLDVEDALGLDYKSFVAATQTRPPVRYGMASVLVPLEDIVGKARLFEAQVDDFVRARDVELLVLMSLVMPEEEGGPLRRSLAVYAPVPSVGAALVDLLLSPDTEAAGLALELVPVGSEEDGDGDGALRKLWCFHQGNTQASRKQVEPILRRLLEEKEARLFPPSSSLPDAK